MVKSIVFPLNDGNCCAAEPVTPAPTYDGTRCSIARQEAQSSCTLQHLTP